MNGVAYQLDGQILLIEVDLSGTLCSIMTTMVNAPTLQAGAVSRALCQKRTIDIDCVQCLL